MTDRTGPSNAVRRVLARDDLIMMATDADKAVGIVRQREALARKSKDEKSLFSVALEHYLKVTRNEKDPAIRAQAWKHAGVIVRFGELVCIPVTLPAGTNWTAEELHEMSLRALDDEEEPGGPPVDLALHGFHRYRAARDLRLAGDRIEDALKLSMVADGALNASGVEPHMAHLMYEVGAAFITSGQARQVERALGEKDSYFTKTRAAGYSTRYRFHFIRAVAAWECGEAATTRLYDALEQARRAAPRRAAGDDEEPDPDSGLALLSVLLTTAEYLAAHGTTSEDHQDALRFAHEALRIADDVRGRWRVIARSRAPLAVVFQRIYGDIALLAVDLGRDAGELGLRVALSAKQTGFAARMRTGHTLMSPDVARIIGEIIEVEGGPRTSIGGVGTDTDTDRKLDRLRFELEEAVSPMLADTVLPTRTRLETLTEVIGTRHALDYLELRDSLNVPYLFRSLIRPGSGFSFERFAPPDYYAKFFRYAGEDGTLATMLDQALATTSDAGRELGGESGRRTRHPDLVGTFDWRVLADEILPEALRSDLAAAAPDRPIELVISSHSWLSMVPWPALRIGAFRLVEHAIITQTPALTCLHHPRPPKVTGRALVRLVGTDGDTAGVDVQAERAAWGLPEGNGSVLFSACDVDSASPPEPLHRLDDAIARWGFAHFAAHGAGRGLSQRLDFPGEAVSFRHALTLRWPGSVLMASCHVGLVLNVTEAEPINLVMGLLSGGARCVVAGIASVDDRGTGEVASQIVRAIRCQRQSLDVALRKAQRAAIDQPERRWALLAAYTQ